MGVVAGPLTEMGQLDHDTCAVLVDLVRQPPQKRYGFVLPELQIAERGSTVTAHRRATADHRQADAPFAFST
jgi:hypothetical protein